MAKRRSIAQYRLIDMAVWFAIMLIFETIVVRAALKWFPAQAYYVSVVPALSAIMYIRWGAWGIVHAVAGGAITSLIMGIGQSGFLIYPLGNALSAAALLYIKAVGGDKVREDALRTLLYGLIVFALMLLGKAMAALLLGSSIDQAFRMFAPEVIVLLFTEVVLWIARRLDGVLESQEAYVRRVQKQQEQERGENA